MEQAPENELQAYRPHMALVAGAASLATVLVLIGIKTFAYFESGSSSVFASLMDSLADITASAMSFLAIHLSLKPADKNHRSGHGKIEGIAALVQAMLIFATGISLLVESVARFLESRVIEHYGLAVGIMAISIVLSIVLVTVQRRILREAPSLAVESDQAHYSMDILINAGVIVILLLMRAGAPPWLDPAFAVVVAGWLGYTAKTIAKKGVDMLLDRELPKDRRQQILGIIRAQDGVLGVHDLRTSQSGMRIFISFDIEADHNLSLLDAHEIARKTELALLEAFPHADIMIHVDPHGDTEDSRHHIPEVHA